MKEFKFHNKNIVARFAEIFNTTSEMLVIDCEANLKQLIDLVINPMEKTSTGEQLISIALALSYHLVKAAKLKSFRFIKSLFPNYEKNTNNNEEKFNVWKETNAALRLVIHLIFEKVFGSIISNKHKDFKLTQLLDFLKVFKELFSNPQVLNEKLLPLIFFQIRCNENPKCIREIILMRKLNDITSITKKIDIGEDMETYKTSFENLSGEWRASYKNYYRDVVNILHQEMISASNEFNL